MVMPWDSEHHPPVAGMRHHNGAVARNEGSIEDQMDSLTGSNDRFYRRVCLAAKIIAERARGVNHHFALGAKLRAGFRIVSDNAVNEIFRVPCERRYRRVVH